MHDYTVGKRLELKRLALKAAMVFAFSSSDIMPRAHIVSRCLIKATPSAARAAQSVRHGSRSRAPSVVCSCATATKGAQHCPDDKAQDILPACCKNWVSGIDSADSAVVGLQTLGQPRQSAPQLRLRCRPSSKR